MRPRSLIFVFSLCLNALPAFAADIRIVPADFIVLNPTNRDKHYGDLMVHAIAVATGEKQSAALTSMRIEVMSGDQVVLSRLVSAE